MADRSTSRGREFHSSGRGGLGNIRASSQNRDTPPDSGPSDFSKARGREAGINTTQVYSTGRGGAGNLRSPSREVRNSPLRPDPIEEIVIEQFVSAAKDTPQSTGRGGFGNISASRSRSRGPTVPAAVHSTGRGGAGNIRSVDGQDVIFLDDAERRKITVLHDGVHSTGRGGAANITSLPDPAIERPRHVHTEFASTGRGGAGNIVHS